MQFKACLTFPSVADAFVNIFLYVNIHIILTEEKTLLKLELRLTVGDMGAC